MVKFQLQTLLLHFGALAEISAILLNLAGPLDTCLTHVQFRVHRNVGRVYLYNLKLCRALFPLRFPLLSRSCGCLYLPSSFFQAARRWFLYWSYSCPAWHCSQAKEETNRNLPQFCVFLLSVNPPPVFAYFCSLPSAFRQLHLFCCLCVHMFMVDSCAKIVLMRTSPAGALVGVSPAHSTAAMELFME